MGAWQGKPVAATVSQQITAEAVPVTSGGFALRIKSVAYPSVRADSADAAEKKARMVAPAYPAALPQWGVQGVLSYAYTVEAAGKAVDDVAPQPAFVPISRHSRGMEQRHVLQATATGSVPQAR